MKTLLTVVGILSVFNLATCYVSPYDTSRDTSSDMKVSTYVQYLRQRQQMEQVRTSFEKICPDKEEELDEAIIAMKECADKVDENSETTCSIIKNHFLRCSRPLVQLLEECLPDRSKEVPKLVFEGITSAVQYLCKTDGEHIFELANACVFKPNYESMRCERRVKTKLQQYRNQTPTKTELCELAQSLKPCFHNHLQKNCGHRITRDSFMGIFDALTAPCKMNTSSGQLEHNDINEVELLN